MDGFMLCARAGGREGEGKGEGRSERDGRVGMQVTKGRNPSAGHIIPGRCVVTGRFASVGSVDRSKRGVVDITLVVIDELTQTDSPK